MRRRIFVFGFLLIFGLLGLSRSIDNPRVQTLHGSDVVQLMASGACFGVAFGLLWAGASFPARLSEQANFQQRM